MKKLLIVLVAFSLTGFLWSYTPSLTPEEIKNKVDNSGSRSSVTKGNNFNGFEYRDSTGKFYAYLTTVGQYFHQDTENNVIDWWFTFTTPGEDTASVAINFANLSSCSSDSSVVSVDTDIYVLYNGASYNGTVSGVPCNQPDSVVSMVVTMDDGSTASLSYSDYKFSISAN